MPNTAVFNEIREILEQNGSIDQATKDRLLLTAIVCVHVEIEQLKKKVDERNTRGRDRVERLVDAAIGALISLFVAYVFVKVTGFAP